MYPLAGAALERAFDADTPFSLPPASSLTAVPPPYPHAHSFADWYSNGEKLSHRY